MKTLIKIVVIVYSGIFFNISVWGGDNHHSDVVGIERIAQQPRSYCFQTTIHSVLG